jgi:hypothetical protein
LKFKSTELQSLYDQLEADYGTYDYLMSSDADDEWEFRKEEDGLKDREKWAHDEESFNMDMGNAAHYFDDQEKKDHLWIVHFTNENAYKIAKEGFKGRDTFGIGLTTHFKKDANQGHLVFGYPIDEVKQFFGYGKNAILAKVKEALVAYHVSDYETQAIFDNREVEIIYPLDEDDGDLVILDKEENEVGRCPINEVCLDKLTGIIEKEKLNFRKKVKAKYQIFAREAPKWNEQKVEHILKSKSPITPSEKAELFKAIDYWEYINDISDEQWDDDVLQNVTKELTRIGERLEVKPEKPKGKLRSL